MPGEVISVDSLACSWGSVVNCWQFLILMHCFTTGRELQMSLISSNWMYKRYVLCSMIKQQKYRL